ncbi:MAG: DUF2892 domain-containing protein [Calditrichaeota bacterium]|nr:MAG: DUF2892 domain-containing protein [Calditrichota bacterium]
MKPNIGLFDKLVRYLAGILALTWGYYAQNWWGLLGFIPLFTAMVGWCPIYSIFGFSTLKKEAK